MKKQQVFRLVALSFLLTISTFAVATQTRAFTPETSQTVVHGVKGTFPGVAHLQTTPAAVTFPNVESFEGTWPTPGWQIYDRSTTDGGDYFWGKSSCQVRSGVSALYVTGGGVEGSKRACTTFYPNNASTWAVYGPFDLTDIRAARVSFYMYGQTPPDDACQSDFLFIGESNNGSVFEGDNYCGIWTGGFEANGYSRLSLDLRYGIGQPNVWIAFNFKSDAQENDIGFSIDEVKIEKLQTTFLPSIYQLEQSNIPAN